MRADTLIRDNAHNAFITPAAFEARNQGVVAKPRAFAPLSQSLSLPRCRQQMARPSIAALLFHRSPPDISGFVVTVIVDAIKGVFGCGAASYLLDELIDRCEQKSDTTPTVMSIRSIAGILATLFRFVIGAIFWRHFTSSRFSVCRTSNIGIASATPARPGLSVAQRTVFDIFQGAAVTPTKPKMSPALFVGIANNRPTVKAFAIQIGELSRKMRESYILNVRHFASYLGDLFRVAVSVFSASVTRSYLTTKSFQFGGIY